MRPAMSAHSERNSHRANGKVSSQNLRYDSAAIVRSASQAFHEQGGPLPEAIDTRRFQKNQRKVCTQSIPTPRTVRSGCGPVTCCCSWFHGILRDAADSKYWHKIQRRRENL